MPSTAHTRGVFRPKQVRDANSAVVLRLLRRFDRMSRAEIARKSGLSEGTVSRIVAGLLELPAVSEVGAENSTGGRPATRLQLSDFPVAIGVEIQNWETRFAVTTTRGKIIENDVARTPSSPADALSLIAERVGQYQRSYQQSRVQGVGIAARGIINNQTGVVELGNDDGWVKVPLRASLEPLLKLPVYVDNDARAAAIAEYNYTSAGEHAPHCLLYVRVDEGVGVGIVLNGEVYSGPSMSAGEFGQMVIADDEGPARQDRPGSLERLVSNQAICGRYGLLKDRRVSTACDGGARVRRICQDALNGDADARQAVQRTSRFLGLGIVNIAWGLDPEAIVLNTSLNMAWPILLDEIRAQFPPPGASPTFRNLIIQPSAFGEQSTLIGAATLAFGPLFDSAAFRFRARTAPRKAVASV